HSYSLCPVVEPARRSVRRRPSTDGIMWQITYGFIGSPNMDVAHTTVGQKLVHRGALMPAAEDAHTFWDMILAAMLIVVGPFQQTWMLGPFAKPVAVNAIVAPNQASRFHSPM